MNTQSIDLRKTAQHLKESGIDISDRKLRDHLVSIGAIRKSQFGYEVTPQFRAAGLLKTQIRNFTRPGEMKERHYTVVVVTGDGLSWLRDEVSTRPH